MKRIRRRSQRFNAQPKPDRWFRRAEVLVGGTKILACAGFGGWEGRKMGIRKVDEAERDMNGVKAIKTIISAQGNVALETMKTDPECDPCQQELKRQMRELKMDESSECGKAIMNHWRESQDQWRRLEYDNSLRTMLGLDQLEAKVSKAREDVPKYTAIGAGIGLIPGILLAFIAVNVMREARKRSLEKKAQQNLEETLRRTGKYRIRQKKESPAKEKKDDMAEHEVEEGSSVKNQVLKPVDSSEFHIERLKERKEMERRLEKAIRRVCGRRCSEQVAYAIASELADNKMEELINQPGKLESVLVENKVKIGPVLGRHGWRVSEVIKEIRKKGMHAM